MTMLDEQKRYTQR